MDADKKELDEFVSRVFLAIQDACAEFTDKTERYIDQLSVEFIPHGLMKYSQAYSVGLVTPHIAQYREADLRTF